MARQERASAQLDSMVAWIVSPIQSLIRPIKGNVTMWGASLGTILTIPALWGFFMQDRDIADLSVEAIGLAAVGMAGIIAAMFITFLYHSIPGAGTKIDILNLEIQREQQKDLAAQADLAAERARRGQDPQ